MERHDDGTLTMIVTETSDSAIDARITLAYDVAQGDAFGRYEPYDFVLAGHPDSDLGPVVRWDASDGEVLVDAPNVLILRGVRPGGDLVLRGLDPNRDIKVDARRLRYPS